MRTLRSGLRAVLVLSLMLSGLMLAAPAADAVESGPVCERGVLTADNQCEIEGDGTVGFGECPDFAIDDGDECYEFVPATLTCPGGDSPIDGMCRLAVPDVPGPPLCADEGAPNEAGLCETFAPADIERLCRFGEPEEVAPGEFACIERTPADSEFFCLDTVTDDGTCVQLVPGELVCVAPSYMLGDGCATDVDPIVVSTECPLEEFDIVETDDSGSLCAVVAAGLVDCPNGVHAGSGICEELFDVLFDCSDQVFLFIFAALDIFGIASQPDGIEWQGECYLIDLNAPPGAPCPVPDLPLAGTPCGIPMGPPVCAQGDFVTGVGCVAVTTGLVVCPGDTTEVGFDDGGEPVCVGPFEAFVTIFACPLGAVETDGGCAELSPKEFVCIDGALAVLGSGQCGLPGFEEPIDFCVRGDLGPDGDCVENFGPPIEGFVCAEGAVVGDQCLVLVEPSDVVSSCGGALGAPGGCYVLVEATLDCGELVPDPVFGPSECRLPVEVGGGEPCNPGFDFVDERCLTYVDAVWFCAGRVVTHNMNLGDNGIGTNGDDVILGTPGNDYIFGGGGRDVICGGRGNDDIYGGPGRDAIYGENGSDLVHGGPGNDFVQGGGGNDDIYGQDGNDDLRGGNGDDNIVGGRNEDFINGGGGDDFIRGGNGGDTIDGSSGTDICFGGSGIDIINTCENPTSAI